MNDELNLRALLSVNDSTMMIVALQALHRERAAAWNAAISVAIMRKHPQPERELFGLADVETMLRRVGAAPSCY